MGMPELAYNDAGLIPCIVQDADTREVLMMAWMNAESLALTLERGVRNAMRFAGISLEQAAAMASANVADALGLADRGRIRPGLRADLCLLDTAGEVRMTLVAGKIVYER